MDELWFRVGDRVKIDDCQDVDRSIRGCYARVTEITPHRIELSVEIGVLRKHMYCPMSYKHVLVPAEVMHDVPETSLLEVLSL